MFQQDPTVAPIIFLTLHFIEITRGKISIEKTPQRIILENGT